MTAKTSAQAASPALRKHETLFEIALRQAGIMVFHYDHELRYTWGHNPHPDYPIEQLIGRTDAEVVAGPLGEELVAFKRQVLETGVGARREVSIELGGEMRTFEVSATPALEADGHIGGVTVAAFDVTERKRTEDRLRLALSSAGMTAWDWDLRTNEVFTENAGAVWGRNAGAGEDFARRIHPEDREVVDRAWAAAAAGTARYAVEYRVVDPDGRVRWLHSQGMVRRDAAGKPYRLSGVSHEITERKDAEQRLRASQDALRRSVRIYRAIGESIDYGIWICDPDGHNVYASTSFLALVGRTQEQCSQLGWGDVLHPDDAEATMAAWRECVRTGGFWEREHRFLGTDGRYHAVLARGVPIRDDDGSVLCWAGINLDIGELKRTEQALRSSEARFQAFMSNVPARCFIKDADGRYTYVNTGSPVEALDVAPTLHVEVGFTDAELVPPDIAAAWRANDRIVLEEQRCVRAIEPAPGHEREFLSIKFPMRDGEGRLAVGGIAIDVTEQRRAHVELQEADRRKDQFLAMLAHELRNPLAPIANAVQVIRRVDPPAGEVRWAREVIERQVDHLARLVDDLLDVSRITQGKVKLRREPLELMTVVARAIETSRPVIDARRQQLSVSLPSEPVRLEGDLTRLAQVLANLLNNAGKYTDEGGLISLAAETSDEEVTVRVRDTGAGIPADLLPRVFDLFMQADRSLDRSAGGLGVGLTLVRSLVEMHGGRVEAHSDGPGKGSEFVVRLPRLRSVPTHPVPGEPLPIDPTRARRRVLVVDDNVDSAESLGLLLKLWGHDVDVAFDGESALECAQRTRPDVVLLDIGLPGMNGYEVAACLRDRPQLASTTIVALTGYGRPDDQARARAAGFDHHLVKPVDVSALETLLAS